MGRRTRAPLHYRNHVEVGPSKAYAYQSLQSALDSITGSAADNRFLVTLAPGVYGTPTDAPVKLDKSFVDIVGAGPNASILARTDHSSSVGGTLVIGFTDGVTVEDVMVSNLRVVRDDSGDVGPPEGAIYLGRESNHPAAPGTWKNVTLQNVIAEGVHDAIQIFGLIETHTGEAPYAAIRGCIARCTHDAVALKGSARVLSQGNQIDVDSRGRPPYLTNVGEWKSTGIHINASVSEVTGGQSAASWFVSSGDYIHVRDGSNVDLASPPVGAYQRRIAGVLIYDLGGTTARTVCPVRIVNPTIVVEWNRDGAPAGGGAYGVNTYLRNNVTIPLGNVEVVGGSIFVHQQNTGGSAPATVHAIMHSCEDTPMSYLSVAGTMLRARNDKGGGTAYALRADLAQSTIYSSARSHQANDTGGAGVIAALPMV